MSASKYATISAYLFILMLSTERPEYFHLYFAVYPMFLLIIWVYFTVHMCAFFKINELNSFRVCIHHSQLLKQPLVWAYEDIH